MEFEPRGYSPWPEHGHDAERRWRIQIDFDFTGHVLTVATSRGGHAAIPLRPMSVAQFYREVLDSLIGLGIAAPEITLKAK